ncbi:MerR family transcriptional regulator [Streptomyces albogriseolus]
MSPRTIRSWVARGHLAPAGLDERGRQLFRLADLARAEHATRDRALRLVGIPERSK